MEDNLNVGLSTALRRSMLTVGEKLYTCLLFWGILRIPSTEKKTDNNWGARRVVTKHGQKKQEDQRMTGPRYTGPTVVECHCSGSYLAE